MGCGRNGCRDGTHCHWLKVTGRRGGPKKESGWRARSAATGDFGLMCAGREDKQLSEEAFPWRHHAIWELYSKNSCCMEEFKTNNNCKCLYTQNKTSGQWCCYLQIWTKCPLRLRPTICYVDTWGQTCILFRYYRSKILVKVMRRGCTRANVSMMASMLMSISLCIAIIARDDRRSSDMEVRKKVSTRRRALEKSFFSVILERLMYIKKHRGTFWRQKVEQPPF